MLSPLRSLRAPARSTVRAHRALAAVAAVLVLVTTGACDGEGPPERGEAVDEVHEEPAETASYPQRMAEEHDGDRPVATEGVQMDTGENVLTEPVQYATVDGRAVTGYLARPQGAVGPVPALVVIHEWWGLNDNVRRMTERLAGEGYQALAVDLYGGEVAETPERARELAQAVDQEEAMANLSEALRFLSARRANTFEREPSGFAGVIGWCFGGGKALQLALERPEDVGAVVVYYGEPITDRDRLARLEAPLLGIFGGADQGIPVPRVRAMESLLDEIGADATIHVYEGAGHAFANPSGTRYEPEAAQDAWEKTTAFLDRHLRAEGVAAEGVQ